MDKDVRDELDEIKLMIMGLHQLLQNSTTHTTTNFKGMLPLKSIHKKAIKRIDKAQVIRAIKHYIDEGYRTSQIRDEVMIRFNIGESCFYNYLRELQTLLHKPTTHDTTK